jgi:hypothetical protein
MPLDTDVLQEAKQARDRLVHLQHEADRARIDYHYAIQRLHAGGASLREIADELGLSHQRVHQIVEAPDRPRRWPGRGGMMRHRGARTDLFERFEPEARDAIARAQDEGSLLRHRWVGTEHLLLGLLAVDRGAAATLRTLGVTLEAARGEVVRQIGKGEREVRPGPRPFTVRAKRVIEGALREALARRSEQISGDDLLLALVEHEGGGADALRELGVTPERLRAELGR